MFVSREANLFANKEPYKADLVTAGVPGRMGLTKAFRDTPKLLESVVILQCILSKCV